MSAQWTRPAKASQDLRVYQGHRTPATPEDHIFFTSRYEVTPTYIFRGDDHRYLIPIYGPRSGLPRGWVSRAPWSASPLYYEPHRVWPKADTYVEQLGPVQSWHRADQSTGHLLVLVEDQLSALKLSAMGYDAVAMLGVPNSDRTDNYSGQDRVAEIAQNSIGYDAVVVAFDADAIDQGFKFVRKWGSAFRSPTRVAILERDIKDTSRMDIPRVLGVDK